MRPIKFRAHNKEDGMIYEEDFGNAEDENDGFTKLVEKDGMIYLVTIFANGVCEYKELNADTVLMQFTGITDKNSKEVYEGDIVDVHDTTMGTEDVVRGEVYWCDSYLCWSIQWLPKQSGADSMRLVKKSLKRSNETPSSDLGDRRWWFLEVVGNIYEPDRKEGGL